MRSGVLSSAIRSGHRGLTQTRSSPQYPGRFDGSSGYTVGDNGVIPVPVLREGRYPRACRQRTRHTPLGECFEAQRHSAADWADATPFMEHELFTSAAAPLPLPAGVAYLAGFALAWEEALLERLARISAAAPFRHMVTPGGRMMSVAMTNCGARGWISDRRGYRYAQRDPESGKPWPALPAVIRELAIAAAGEAGYAGFEPDACLINRYTPGARMSLHQDRDEHDRAAPIVSVSLGLPAVFLFGGLTRRDRPLRLPLAHGDVVVWGGPARLAYHGVAPVADGQHPKLGPQRINLTLRRAGLPKINAR